MIAMMAKERILLVSSRAFSINLANWRRQLLQQQSAIVALTWSVKKNFQHHTLWPYNVTLLDGIKVLIL